MEHWIRARFTPNLPLGADGSRVTAGQEHIGISKQAAKEGMVLLKNAGHVLPLARGAKVALFGKGTVDYVRGGGGSGDVYSPYVHNILDGFRALKDEVSVFSESADFYQSYVEKAYEEGGIPGLIPEPEVPQDMLTRAAAWTDTAIISLSRFSGEGWDRKSDFGGPAVEPEDGFTHIHLADQIFGHSDFYLTDAENQMIGEVTAHFSKVIVLLNVGGMVDTRWVRDDDGIQAALITWQGGMAGGDAAAELIMGHGDPSGKLADTFAGTLEDYPSTEGFHESDDYVNYTEDVYVGYRYFETIPGAAEKVVYPFGYGLSYTDFALSKAGGIVEKTAEGDVIRLRLAVTNVGKYDGREVVQAYYSAPQGLLGRPAKELGAYQKTRLLKPGESQLLELTIPASEMAGYDDLGKVKKSAWVLESGNYHFYIGTNVRDTEEPVDEAGDLFCYTLAGPVVVEKCSARLVPSKLPQRMLADGSYEKLTTSGPMGVGNSEDNRYEKLSVSGQTSANGSDENLSVSGQSSANGSDEKSDDYQTDENGLAPMTFEDGKECWSPEVRSVSSHLLYNGLPDRPQLSDVAEGKISLDDFIASLSTEDLAWLVSGTPNTGCANTYGWGNLQDAGVPNVMTADGPAGVRFEPVTGVRTTAFPCATLLACTWDPEIVTAVGAAGGAEAKENNVFVWLTPAVNIHRSPLCGRNFEYYSEDPYLAGKQAAAMVRGIQSNGVAACVKHFALNDKETNRKNSDSRVSERAAREIYLKQFEIIVKEADPWSMMTSYNLINGQRASENSDLLNGILRDEWGYQGTVTTDWWGYGEQYKECAAGNDVKMGCGFPHRLMEAYQKGAVTREQMETAGKHILTTILHVDDAI